MKNASKEFETVLDKITVNNAKIPVYTNVDAKAETLAENFKEKMPKQICSSVYWTQTIEYMISQGVDTFFEIGQGKVLAGLNKKIATDITTYNISDMSSLNDVLAQL